MEAWVHLGGVHGLDSVLIVAIPPLRHQQAPCSTTHRARSNGATRLTGELTFTVAPRSLASQSTKQNIPRVQDPKAADLKSAWPQRQQPQISDNIYKA